MPANPAGVAATVLTFELFTDLDPMKIELHHGCPSFRVSGTAGPRRRQLEMLRPHENVVNPVFRICLTEMQAPSSDRIQSWACKSFVHSDIVMTALRAINGRHGAFRSPVGTIVVTVDYPRKMPALGTELEALKKSGGLHARPVVIVVDRSRVFLSAGGEEECDTEWRYACEAAMDMMVNCCVLSIPDSHTGRVLCPHHTLVCY